MGQRNKERGRKGNRGREKDNYDLSVVMTSEKHQYQRETFSEYDVSEHSM